MILILIAIKKTHATLAVVAAPGAAPSKIKKNRQSSSDAPDKIVQETTFRCTSPHTNNCCNTFGNWYKIEAASAPANERI